MKLQCIKRMITIKQLPLFNVQLALDPAATNIFSINNKFNLLKTKTDYE